MEILLVILAILLALAGLAGSVLPVLPGPPLSFLAVVLLRFCPHAQVSNTLLWVTGILMVVITVLDYVAPTWFTNLSGGTKQGTRGSLVGMLVGLFFFPPIGLIVGPFIGAFVGELIANASTGKALRVALMSFVAFLLTSGVKLIYGGVLLFLVGKEAIATLF